MKLINIARIFSLILLSSQLCFSNVPATITPIPQKNKPLTPNPTSNASTSMAPTTIAPTSQGDNWLASSPVPAIQESFLQSLNSYPAMGIIKTEGPSIANQIINNRTIKATTPPNTVPILRNANFSVLRSKGHEFQNYPTGATLFKDYPNIAQKFDTLIETLIKTPKFIPFFRKVHLNILNELYKYLMNIYTNFNLQHVGIKETQTPQGQSALKINVSAFLQDEEEYAANKKTLIINHMVNVIESQLNGAIRSVMPTIPHLYATFTGKILIQNDYSIDLTHFILKQIEPDVIHYKNEYLQALGMYLDFFQTYTSYMLTQHPKNQHHTAFVDIAESINRYIYGDQTITESQSQEKQLKALLQKMDPPMFTFNYDDIRALKTIPHLAKSLPKQTKKILWPEHIVDAANEIILINGHPMAYFKNAAGDIVKEQEGATKLFIIMESGKNLFEEELLPQPDWLNNWDGVSQILRGCFGDFSALVGLGVLDPCTEALIVNTIGTMEGKNVNEENSTASICQNYLDSFKHQPVMVPKSQTEALQSLSSVLPATQTAPLMQPPTQVGESPASPTLSPSMQDISQSPSISMPSAQDIAPMSPSTSTTSPPLTQ